MSPVRHNGRKRFQVMILLRCHFVSALSSCFGRHFAKSQKPKTLKFLPAPSVMIATLPMPSASRIPLSIPNDEQLVDSIGISSSEKQINSLSRAKSALTGTRWESNRYVSLGLRANSLLRISITCSICVTPFPPCMVSIQEYSSDAPSPRTHPALS